MLLLMKHAINLLSVSVKIRMVFTRVWVVVPARRLHRNALNCVIAEDIVNGPNRLNSELKNNGKAR